MSLKADAAADLVDRIRLHRQVDQSPIIICEGSGDRTVVKAILSAPRAVFRAGPRGVVLDSLSKALDAGLGPVVAVVDRDFDCVVADCITLGLPVVAYDGADLESTLWSSEVLDAALDVLASESKLTDFGGTSAVRATVDDLVRPIARLRTANEVHNLGLDFDELDLRQRIKASDLTLRVDGLCDSLRRGRTAIQRKWLIEQASNGDQPVCPSTGVQLLHGKDRLAALGVVLRRRIGALSHQEAHHENVARAFYSSARRELFLDAPWLTRLDALVDG